VIADAGIAIVHTHNAIMNYLAHAYLSFNQPDILLGNMISDFVKGRRQFDYPAGIQKGIVLHRAIDQFTDAHEEVKRAKIFFRIPYRLYAGAFTDVVFDHFLALHLHQNSDLKAFSTQVYAHLAANELHFPPVFARMFPGMRQHDWLFHYQFEWGVERSFGGLQRRAQYIEDIDPAIAAFRNHYTQLEKCFRQFWPQLHQFARDTLNRL
jgi:acyl carrier protein phosphodiesterase